MSKPSSSPPRAPPSHDIFGYIESLPASSILRLYAPPGASKEASSLSPDANRGQYACRAVLQRLPEIARQFIVRLVVCGGEFPRTELDLWANSNSKLSQEEANSALDEMRKMQVILSFHGVGQLGNKREFQDEEADEHDETKPTVSKTIKLTPQFHDGMKKSMTCLDATPWPEISKEEQQRQYQSILKSVAAAGNSSKSSMKKYPPPPTPEGLEMYTQRRWDSVLHFLVGSDGEEEPPTAVKHFLEKTGLMQEDPDYIKAGYRSSSGKSGAPLVITSKGYEFMLQDVHMQVWQFILEYFQSLSGMPNCDEIRTEALLFLICLSYCRVGCAYPASALSKNARTLMKDFSQFGLLYVCKGVTNKSSSSTFYPTRVAVNLVAGGNATTGSSASATRAIEMSLQAAVPGRSHIAIIVQTNFQLCAYTTSEVHLSMLGLFCDYTTFRRLPNMIFYKVTRDSVKGAFHRGITAKQILSFLKMHAHPRLRTGDTPLVAKNVEDQIWLWERERVRVMMEEVYCLTCQTADEFAAAQRYALDVNAHKWSNEKENKIMVRFAQTEVVLAFVRRWRIKAAKRGKAEKEGGKRGTKKRQTSYS